MFESHTGNNVAELLGNWEWDLERPSNNTAVITDNTMRNTDTALSEILISNSGDRTVPLKCPTENKTWH